MFSLRRKHSMKKWKSDTPHKLQMGGNVPIPPPWIYYECSRS